ADDALGRLVKEADGRMSLSGREEKDQHDAEDEAPVADPVGNKRFLRRRTGFFLVDVVTDEQIRAETDAFPADKHQQEIVPEYQRQHREHEKIQISEEPVVTAVPVHVPGGKDV